MEQAQTPQPSLYTHAAKFGGIMGGISIFLVVIFYVISMAFLATFKFLGLVLVIALGIMIYSGINYRTEAGGYISYGKAWTHGFVVLAVSGLLGLAFNLLLYHVIDPELPQKMADTIIENTEEMMRSFGAPDDTIDQTISGMRDDLPNQFSMGGLCLGYLKNLIGSAVIALITALFVRRNEPVEM